MSVCPWFLGPLYWLHWVSFCLSLVSLSRRWLRGPCGFWFLGRLYWLHWVSFCLSECVLSPLVVGG